MGRWLAFGALFGVLLAGCLTDDGPASGGQEAPTVLPWGLEDCAIVVAVVPATVDALAPYLPEGFRSLSMEEVAGTGTDVAGEANFGIEAFECEAGTTLEGERDSMVYGSYFSAVEPPEGLRHDVDLHFVKWDTLIPDAARRDALRLEGVPAVDGSVSFEMHDGSGAQWAYVAQMDLGGDAFTFTGVSGQDPGGDIRFVEFQQTDAGLVQWHASVDLSQAGLGPVTVALPQGGLAADVLGTPVAMGAGYAGVMTFHEASIVLPA